jgi:hypothetical protein
MVLARLEFGRAMSLGSSALLGTVETSASMVSLRGSKQCHTRRATPALSACDQQFALLALFFCPP